MVTVIFTLGLLKRKVLYCLLLRKKFLNKLELNYITDIRILRRIQDYLHIGRISADKNKPYSMYIVSTK